MSNFVGGNDDARETASVFNDGNGIDLLQSLVDNARTANVRETWHLNFFLAPRVV